MFQGDKISASSLWPFLRGIIKGTKFDKGSSLKDKEFLMECAKCYITLPQVKDQNKLCWFKDLGNEEACFLTSHLDHCGSTKTCSFAWIEVRLF